MIKKIAKKKWDVEFLLQIIRDNPPMDKETRNYLAEVLGDFISRKIRRPAHRPAKSETLRRRYEIATRALVIEEKAARKKMSDGP